MRFTLILYRAYLLKRISCISPDNCIHNVILKWRLFDNSDMQERYISYYLEYMIYRTAGVTNRIGITV